MRAGFARLDALRRRATAVLLAAATALALGWDASATDDTPATAATTDADRAASSPRDGEEIVLIDTAWGEEPTAVLLDWVQRELGKPVTRALATNSHADRVGAPRTLAARGIPLLVHPKTVALAARRGVATTRPNPGDAALLAHTLDLLPASGSREGGSR